MASNQLIASPFCLSVFPYINCLLNRKHNPIFPISSSVSISETRLGDFWKLMETNFLTIIAKIFRDLLGYFERHHFLSKNYCGYFLGNFWKYLGYFVFRHLVTRVFIFNLSFYPHIFPLPNSNLNISFYLSSHLFIPTLNGGFLSSTNVWKVFFLVSTLFLFVHSSSGMPRHNLPLPFSLFSASHRNRFKRACSSCQKLVFSRASYFTLAFSIAAAQRQRQRGFPVRYGSARAHRQHCDGSGHARELSDDVKHNKRFFVSIHFKFKVVVCPSRENKRGTKKCTLLCSALLGLDFHLPF